MTPGRFTRLAPLEEARGHVVGGAPIGTSPGSALPALRTAAVEVRELVRASGAPSGVATRDLVTQPHPTVYGLFRAARSPAPWLWLTDRMLVVCWQDGGRTRTLVWGPSDHELDDTPAMRRMRDRLPVPSRFVRTVHGTVLGQLRALGIDPRDVDHVVFDHLHTQDLRRLLGTTGPAADLDCPTRVDPWFPNATLLVQRAEWESVRQPHPLQSPWYRPESYVDLPEERIDVLDGDRLLGPGVALVCTPGHTLGNQSLVLHTDAGVQVVSGNGILAEAWAPASSDLPGLQQHTNEAGPAPHAPGRAHSARSRAALARHRPVSRLIGHRVEQS